MIGVLSYMVESAELLGGVGLHGGDCWVALCRELGYMMGVLSYMVESVRLYGGDCWVT